MYAMCTHCNRSVTYFIGKLKMTAITYGFVPRNKARRSLAVTFIRAKLGREGMVGPSVVLI